MEVPVPLLSAGRRTTIIALMAAVMFMLNVFSGIIAPLVVDIARDLSTTVPVVAQLATITTLTWAALAPIIGPLTDRFGRKPILIIGLLWAGIWNFACGMAWDYPSLFVFRLLVGFGAGSMGPTIWASVGDYFPIKERGRASSWILVGLSLAFVVGVPALALESQYLGWRYSFVTTGIVAIIIALIAGLFLPAVPGTAKSLNIFKRLIAAGRYPVVFPFISANTLTQASYSTVMTFLPAFAMLNYGLTTSEVAPLVSFVAIGSIIGNLAGGQLADRGWLLRLCALGPLGIGIIGALLFSTVLSVVVTAVIGIIAVASFALTRPAYASLAAELSPEARGTVMGLNTMSNQIGYSMGSALGGLVLALLGFGAIGLVVLLLSVASTLIGYLFILNSNAASVQRCTVKKPGQEPVPQPGSNEAP